MSIACTACYVTKAFLASTLHSKYFNSANQCQRLQQPFFVEICSSKPSFCRDVKTSRCDTLTFRPNSQTTRCNAPKDKDKQFPAVLYVNRTFSQCLYSERRRTSIKGRWHIQIMCLSVNICWLNYRSFTYKWYRRSLWQYRLSWFVHNNYVPPCVSPILWKCFVFRGALSSASLHLILTGK